MTPPQDPYRSIRRHMNAALLLLLLLIAGAAWLAQIGL